MRSSQSNKALIVSILMMALGLGRLLIVHDVLPQVNWIFTLGMAAIGFLCFLLLGFDKVSVVVGPFFLAGSLLSLLRQLGHVSLDSELPLLVILIGALLFITRYSFVPAPSWIDTSKPRDE